MPVLPQPGSRRARQRGCTCQPLDPDKTFLGYWWIAPGCPIHDTEETDQDDE